MPVNASILCTRPVKETLVAEAAAMGIRLVTVPLIDTEPVLDIDVQQEVEQIALQYATVVFTSMNAVESVITMLDQQVPEWHIYCMGTTTATIVREYFGDHSIRGTGSSAADLADAIIESGETDEVVFFCGDQRRDELPEKLTAAEITVHEVMVYRTLPLYKKIEATYDGILFFSPSAVDSYFKYNKPAAHTVLFAIGHTTEKAIKQYSDNKIISATTPGKEELVKMAVNYLGEQ